jgi:hypothetical protein
MGEAMTTKNKAENIKDAAKGADAVRDIEK